MCKNIYLDAPNIGEPEKRYLNKAIDSGYVSTIGPFVAEFEKRFAEYLGAVRAVSTQSGTGALHISLHELGIGKGDEVIVPALTFIATVNPIIYVGAKPVFVDVDIRTWTIDPEEIERNITRRTKAIIAVHLYGNPCDMDAVMKIAKRHDLYVIEDATESLGARYKNRYTGTIGDLGCFSFNGNKIITTGGGGMVVGNDRRRLDHIKYIVNQARDETRSGYYHTEIGFNYRMTNIEAALGLAQMRRLGRFLETKRRIAAMYRKGLKEIKDIGFQEELSGAKSSWWLTSIVLGNGAGLSSLQEGLRSEGISTRRVFMPLPEQPPYKTYKKRDYKNSYSIYERGLCLPSSTLNSKKGIQRVYDAVKDALNNMGKKK